MNRRIRGEGALVTDGLLRKSLAVARSLGNRGIPVTIAEHSRWTPAGCSRYAARRKIYPDPRSRPDAFLAWLNGQLGDDASGDAVFYPMDDAVMDIAVRRQAAWPARAAAMLPPADGYAAARDKGRTVQWATACGVETPLTRFPASREEALRQGREIGFPLVLKPRFGSGSRGIRVLEHEAMLAEAVRAWPPGAEFPILQQYLPPGERYDVCLLYGTDGDLLYSFVQRELRHYPLERGPSTVQESVRRPDLLERALRMMKHVPWRGAAEFEFMTDPRDGEPKLMEVNPRFWNSLYLAQLCGVDFPYGYYLAASGQAVRPVHDYPIGVRCRNLWPSDLLHWMANPKRGQLDPPFWPWSRGAPQDDIWSLRDPGAWAGFAVASAVRLFDRETWRLLVDR